MKEPGPFGETLPDGVELTLGELQEMACRQQHQIDSQHQLLVAKEQRLRFLKQQEARHHQVAAENERLRRLRDRVEAQELKLRKLRALRGQVDQNKLNNASLTSDLDSIRALFNEKEKELSLAVAKVEELTHQLEELKRGRGASARDQQQQTPSPAALELDKLRRELMYRNKLNEQQNARLCQQREALSQRQEEMSNIDKRISELQDRLHRKRLLNQQMANQITAASNKASGQQQLRSAASATTIQQHQYHQQQVQGGKGKLLRPLTSGNIAAIEPYHHVPVTSSDPEKQSSVSGGIYGGQKQAAQIRPIVGDGITHLGKEGPYHSKHIHQQSDGMSSQDHKNHAASQDDFHTKLVGISGGSGANLNTTSVNNGSSTQNSSTKNKDKDDQYLPEFGGSKSDPKYQTLPYNTKFTVNFVSSVASKVTPPDKRDSVPTDDSQRNNNDTNETAMKNNNNINNMNNNNNINNPSAQQQLMTVHSIPIPALSGVSKGLATPLLNQSQSQQPPHRTDQSMAYQQQSVNKMTTSAVTAQMLGHIAPRPFGSSHSSYTNTGLSRGQPVGGTSSTTSSTSSLATNSSSTSSSISHQKPVSSVAPTSVQHQKPSPIYQTSSTKIHPVQPQTLSSTPQGILRELRGELSPPQSTSTPVSTPEGLHENRQCVGKPALPPKPALPVKPTPPPRQTQHCTPSAVNTAELDVGRVDISADAVDSALSVLRGAPAGLRGGLTSHQEQLLTKLSQQQVPSELDENQLQQRQTSSTVTTTCPPPPPPTSEPPDDIALTNISNQKRFAGVGGNSGSDNIMPVIKACPLTIKKQPSSDHPKLKAVNFVGNGQSGVAGSSSVNGSSGANVSGVNNNGNSGVHVSINRRIEMPPAFLFPETEAPPADLISSSSASEQSSATFSSTTSVTLSSGSATSSGVSIGNVNLGVGSDEVDRAVVEPLSGSEVDNNLVTRKVVVGEENSSQQKQDTMVDALNNINAITQEQQEMTGEHMPQHIMARRAKKGNLKAGASSKVAPGGSRRVSFDPLALLLDASLEGELELVRKTAGQVSNPSAANDEGITALHNAICAGHLDIVKFLVEFGCDVNAQDSDGWTPLHCAASCNNLAMVRFLVEHGACIFATTLSDHETAAEKCEEDEEGFDGCSEYLYSVQEKLGILNSGVVYAVYDYEAHNSDELSFKEGDKLIVLRKGDEWEREWWWSRLNDQEGYIPRNLLGLYSRVHASKKPE